MRALGVVHALDGVGRKVHIRPRQFISADGTKLLNLWYLPHFTEVCVCCDLTLSNGHSGLSIVMFQVFAMFSSLERHSMMYCLHTVLVGRSLVDTPVLTFIMFFTYFWQKVVSSLHTIVMFITTYARLGDSFGFKLKSKDHQGASWGGAERLGKRPI